MRSTVLARAAGALAVGAAVGLAVYPLLSVDADEASCSVTPSSYADAVLNPPKGEDTDFFVNTGGIPSLMLLVDTSRSMLRLPPDGASLSWGSFEGAATSFGCDNDVGNTVAFHSSCGLTTLEGQPFNPPLDGLDDPPVWAEAKDASGRYCPYMVSGNQPMGRDKPGYDPDFYPALFSADRVYHDTIASSASGAIDGWGDFSGNPTADASVPGFCGRASWSAAQQTSCTSCMKERGYWFDGSYVAWTGPSCAKTADCQERGLGTCIKDATGVEHDGNNDNSAHCRVPNVWFSGNFLNFYPPKFVVARKVLKDVVAVARKLRLGLTTLNADDGGLLLEPLTPTCDKVGAPSSWDASRTAIMNAINNGKVRFTNEHAPLAEALLDAAQLYATRSNPWFNSTFANSAFMDDAATKKSRSVCYFCQATAVLMISDGQPTTDGIIPGLGFAASPMTRAVANTTGNYAGMAGYNITEISDADCPVCNTAAEAADTTLAAGECLGQQLSGACASTVNPFPIPSYLPKVAWYLHNMDFRDDNETAPDGFKNKGKQNITTYTIGLATRGNTSLVLEHTATAGGGFYNGGSGADVTDAKALREAILRVMEDVNTRSTSFGAASLSTLQASASQGVLVPRFEPSRSAHWNGHLYAFDLYSEFTGDSPACHIPTSGASGPANGDYDCDGRCTSVFLKDADGDFIQEDGTGAFKKNSPRNRAACGYGNRCTSCGTASNTDAKPRWDAGDKLSPLTVTTDPLTGVQTTTPKTGGYKAWDERNVYTVTDSDSDGKFTSADRMVKVTPSTVADTLAPYLNIKGTGYCSNLAARLTAVGNPAGTTIEGEFATGVYSKCAEVILQYVLGADVFNERRCSGFPNTYCTRPYQLGDVFHSSPVEVWPPLPSDGYLCARGLHPQCLASLFSSSIANPSASGRANAYDDYAKDLTYKHRKKFALVGANDGMLHAFVTAKWRNADDPRTTPREDLAPFDGFHDDRPSTVPEVGDELWAFISPDLLPKLRLLLESTHHFFVDGTAMVRDVWMDGGHANRSDSSTSPDEKRQGTEFHTIAIMGERRGGTHYFALDVTDATDDLDGKPRFLWLYPQPNDPEELAFGETYVEFVPKPPPIGPVRIDAGTACAADAPRFTTAAGESRCFKERWIAFLSGGFDVQYTKGRGVHMVDVATGEELWDFSQPEGAASTCTKDSDPRCHLNYPVAATVGMMMWGKKTNFLSAAAIDGYFDTATFGDTGGQLWVLRFSDPGVIDGTTKKVENWYGARVFQHAKASSAECGLNYCEGQPFFYITSNLPLQANGLYRVLAGTGDRFNLLDPVGGVCGPDNLRACIMKGCTVTLEDSTGGPGAVFGVEPLLGTQSYGMDHAASCSTVDASGYTFDRTDSSGSSCTTVTSKIDGLVITCPSAKTCSGLDETTKKKMALSCNAAGSCEPATTNELGSFIDLKGNLDRKNWFFSIQVFENTDERGIFHDLEGAQKYDEARLSEDDLVDVNAHDADASKPLATADSKGWKYYFDHGSPSTPTTTTIGGTDYDIFRTDERNASVSAVEASCTFWNTMQTGVPQDSYDDTSGCPVNSPCKAARTQLSYLYGASPSTGGLCLHIDGSPMRFQKNETLVPPHIGKLVAYVSSGQVSFGLTSVRIPQGGSNIALGEVQDIQSVVEWLPVDHATHECRHSPKDQPAPLCR